MWLDDLVKNEFREIGKRTRQSLNPHQQEILQTYPKPIPLPTALSAISKQSAQLARVAAVLVQRAQI